MSHDIRPEDHSALRLERIWIRDAIFRDAVSSNTESIEAVKDLGFEITLDVGASFVDNERRALVSLRLTVKPPAALKYFEELSARVEGAFVMANPEDTETLKAFASAQAPVILLPYARQVISSLTAESRLGAVVLPPINMQAVIDAMRGTKAPA